MTGKAAFRDSFRNRGLVADAERVVLSSGGDRRADVLIQGSPPNRRSVAIGLQHQSIGLDEIERRTGAYMGAGIPVVGIPFLKQSVWDDAEEDDEENEGYFFIKKYSAPPWQRWLTEYMGDHPLWFYGQEKGGYWYDAKRWMSLHLCLRRRSEEACAGGAGPLRLHPLGRWSIAESPTSAEP